MVLERQPHDTSSILFKLVPILFNPTVILFKPRLDLVQPQSVSAVYGDAVSGRGGRAAGRSDEDVFMP